VRVSVVAGADAGHAFPAAGLAFRLRAAGHAVRVFTGARWIGALGRDGMAATALPDTAPAGAEGEAAADWAERLHRRAARAAPALAELIAAEAPDLVVADTLTASGSLAAELLGLPWVELVPHSLQVASAALPPPGSGLAPGRTPAGRARDALLRRMHGRSVALGRRQRAAARLTIGLPGDDPGPAHRLVATLPALEPPRPDWPPNTDIVGPLGWDPATTDLRLPPGDGPLIFVSPPTASSGRRGLVEAMLAALPGLRATPPAGERGAADRASAAGPGAGRTSGGSDAGDRRVRVAATVFEVYGPEVPEGACVGPGRQAPVLAHAAVVVGGGGHGLVSKALAAGLPMVLTPGGGDQRDVAARVRRMGAGLVVPGDPDPDRLAAAVRRVLADAGYAEAARAAAATVSRVVDPVRLCERLAVNGARRAEG
jgi:UDP:flavonoid glycosyltransferase YjiC (YdhE family)